MTDASTVLDTDRLESLVEEIGDRGLVRQAIATFIGEVPTRLEAIREALSVGDDPEIKATAHALGSPAAMLGAVGVRASSRALQDAATEGRSDLYADLHAELESVTAVTVSAMTDYLASDSL
jgi:two-component system, sensor histidine kinase